MNFNANSPTVKRLLSEINALRLQPEKEFVAGPIGDDLFIWHFTIKGPRETPFEGGIYHGKIVFPQQYPLKPPDIYFLTPSGRFETGKKICLTMTSYHPDLWNPAWDVRTALTSIIAYMPSPGEGAIGAIDAPAQERKKLALLSHSWHCKECNLTIEPDEIKETGEASSETSASKTDASSTEEQNNSPDNTNTETNANEQNNDNDNNNKADNNEVNNKNEVKEIDNINQQQQQPQQQQAQQPTSQNVIKTESPPNQQNQQPPQVDQQPSQADQQPPQADQQPPQTDQQPPKIDNTANEANAADAAATASGETAVVRTPGEPYVDENGVSHYNFEELRSVPFGKRQSFVPLLDIPIVMLFLLLMFLIANSAFNFVQFS